MNNVRHTQGKYVINALSTKRQRDSRHTAVFFSTSVFPGMKLLITGGCTQLGKCFPLLKPCKVRDKQNLSCWEEAK